MTERIAIAGAGISGAYLYRLLALRGIRTEVFGRRSATRCGIEPCAWGTSRGFRELAEAAGLDPERYVLNRIPYIEMDEFRLPADLITFDKPLFLGDLLEGAEIRYEPVPVEAYGRLFDATGTSRAFLPPLADDLVLPCVQSRLRTDADLGNRIRLGGIGYAWCFPLGREGYHIGCGSLLDEPRERIRSLSWVEEAGGDVRCSCTSRIRLASPHASRPFVWRRGETQIWGIGEAIGCVAPLAGDGILAGMRSAALALDCWYDADRYEAEILREFAWMEKERRVLDKLRVGRKLSGTDALVLRRNSRRMGMTVSFRQALRLMERIGGPGPVSRGDGAGSAEPAP